jgi:hypothetical protein
MVIVLTAEVLGLRKRKAPAIDLEVVEEEDVAEAPLVKKKKRSGIVLQDSPSPSPHTSPSAAEEYGRDSAEVPPLLPEVGSPGIPPATAPPVTEQIRVSSPDLAVVMVQEGASPVDIFEMVEQPDTSAPDMGTAMVLFGAEPDSSPQSPAATSAARQGPEESSSHDEGISLKREVFPELEEVVPTGPRWSRPAAETLEDVYCPGIVSLISLCTCALSMLL